MANSKNGKVVSKYHRLRLTDEIRTFVQGLPVTDLVETQVGNHVYMASGFLRLGVRKYPVNVRIAHKDGKLLLLVKSGRILEVQLPYDTREQRAQASVDVSKQLESLLS